MARPVTTLLRVANTPSQSLAWRTVGDYYG